MTGGVASIAAPSPPRHEAVHALRGACVLAVFAYHVLNSRLPPPPSGEWDAALRWLGGGLRYGVEVFFMISGYVIVQSLRRHASVGAFLRDRALRIFPLWLPLALALVLAGALLPLPGLTPPQAWSSPPVLLASLLILAPLLPVPTIHYAQWSLCYELAFYALAAAYWRFGRRRHAAALACALAALALVTLFPRALFFSSGVAVALAEPWLRARAPALRHAWLGLAAMVPAWLATGADAADRSGRTLAGIAADGAGAALVALAWLGGTAFFAWVVVRARMPASDNRAARAMAWLGTVSYSFYLVHPLVMAVVKRGLLPALHLHGWAATLALAALALPLSCLASQATWRLFEVGLRRRLRGLAGGRGGVSATAAHSAGVPR